MLLMTRQQLEAMKRSDRTDTRKRKKATKMKRWEDEPACDDEGVGTSSVRMSSHACLRKHQHGGNTADGGYF